MHDIFMHNLQIGGPGSVNTSPHPWEKLDWLAQDLCYSLCDYEYIWEEAILELPIENGAFVTPDGQRIDTVLLNGSVYLSAEAVEKLKELLAQGGKVIGVGGKIVGLEGIPLYVDGASAVKNVEHRITKDSSAFISFTHRIAENREFFFLLNERDDAVCTTIHFPTEGALSEFNFETESFEAVDSKDATLSFAPRQLRILSLTTEPEADKAAALDEAVAIDGWKLTLADGTVKTENVLGDWRRWEDPCYTGVLTYSAELKLDTDADILLDLGTVNYAARIRVDGAEKLVPFSPFTTELSLSAGNHVLEVDVMNTDANKKIGTPEREAMTSGDRHQSMYEHDRFRLESGLYGPVTYRVMKK